MQLIVVVPRPLLQLFFLVIGWDARLQRKEEFKRGNRISSGIWGMPAIRKRKEERWRWKVNFFKGIVHSKF